MWFEDDTPGALPAREMQISELSFLGSRWERDGIRKVGDEEFLADVERGPNEVFFIGEINNKENPDYVPPFPVHEENHIPEKEQSLVLDFTDLEPGHVARLRKQISPQGDDYTQYETLTWYVFNSSAQTADLDVFTRVGSDTLNYYEVGMRFAESSLRTGWQRVNMDLAQLANVKNDSADADGVIRTELVDEVTGEIYDVRVVGQPDLRRVKRYYFGVANNTRWPVSGKLYLNDVILRGVQRNIGFADRVGVRLNMADVIKVDFDWSQQDAEFHGLNAAKGQGFADENWNLSTNFRVDDFLPLLGFQLPVSLSRSKASQRPKYETNSDIEILEEDVRNELSSLDNRESFSVRLSRQPSRRAIPRYVIDPWTVQLSGSRSDRTSPTEDSNQKTLQGSLNYDLRIAGSTTLAKLPMLGRLPLLRGLSLLPQKISLGANFSGNERNLITRDLDGNETPRPSTSIRTGSLQSSVDYQAWQVITVGWRNRSERDLLRPQEVLGVNIGEENKYTMDVQVSFEVPKVSLIPGGLLFWPLRQVSKGLAKMNPSVTYNGGFVDIHDPNQRQITDPPDIRNVSNTGDWEMRGRVPLGDVFKSLFPERRRSEQDQARLIQEQQRLEARDRGRGRDRPGGPPGRPTRRHAGRFDGDSRSERVDDRRVRGPHARRAPATRAGAPAAGGGRATAARTGGRAVARGAADDAGGRWCRAGSRATAPPWPRPWRRPAGGRGFPNLLSPVFGALRGLGQVQVSYTDRNGSNYSRVRERAPFLYRLGTHARPRGTGHRLHEPEFQRDQARSRSRPTRSFRAASAWM